MKQKILIAACAIALAITAYAAGYAKNRTDSLPMNLGLAMSDVKVSGGHAIWVVIDIAPPPKNVCLPGGRPSSSVSLENAWFDAPGEVKHDQVWATLCVGHPPKLKHPHPSDH